MTEFFRFPHTPHITWLGEGSPRDDKVLSRQEVDDFLIGEVLVEEKLDGANLGISINAEDELQAQNRGQYLIEPYSGQFSRLTSWLGQHRYQLLDHLQPDWILFGEWCAAKHSLDYLSLPDWFVLFDVYDRQQEKFWSNTRRDNLAGKLGLQVVPDLYQGKITLKQLIDLLSSSKSRYRKGTPEGVVIRKQTRDWCEARAKLVRAEFTQAIDDHWRSRSIEWNKVSSS
ncbi:MAG: RNA ligase family protein [Pseudomonadales bacterium]|nr:RNA ligase family protein [Pseudomonadales bacterium]